jgi:hypothetical protein
MYLHRSTHELYVDMSNLTCNIVKEKFHISLCTCRIGKAHYLLLILNRIELSVQYIERSIVER